MNDLAGPYKGMDRFECREKILEDLKEEGLLEKIEPYRHAVGHCYRCKTMIEPLLSKQWFVKIGPLAKKAITAVEEGRTRIIPSTWEPVYFEWMRNIKDWCVSRQIWWGHRIPAWYCRECENVIVSRDEQSSALGARAQISFKRRTCLIRGLVPLCGLSRLSMAGRRRNFKPSIPPRLWSQALISSSSGWPE
jgi:valyl-tRNA synthetase